MTFPEARPVAYDPDLTWDEDAGTWGSDYVSVISNRVEYIIVIGEQGEIYFEEVV